MKTTFSDYKVIYEFTKSRFGFQNQVTVNATSEESARLKAMEQICDAYGSKMLKYFKIVKIS